MSSCIWKDIITSCVFRNPLRIRFPHKTDCLAQIIQPYCRVWKTYNGMEICDYALCRATVGMAFAVFSFDNIMRISCGLCSTSRISISNQCERDQRKMRTSPCWSDCVNLKFYAPKGGQSVPLFYIYYEKYYERPCDHPILIFSKGVLRCEQIRMRQKAPALYKRLWKRGNYWKGVL